MTWNLARSSKANRIARGINLVLGIWLFVSAFLWNHGVAQRTNTWIMGVLFVVLAFIAMSVPTARFLNTILSVWLFISVWVLPHQSQATMWNNGVIAVLVFEITLMSGGQGEHGPSPSHRPA